MFDVHYVPENWGVLQTIFGISTYSLFVGLGILIGIIYYSIDARNRGAKGENAIIIVASALFFGMLGAKLPLLLMNYEYIGSRTEVWLEGKTIVGGFIGGILGVVFIKRLFKIKLKLGNIIAPAAAIGMGIGRIGCFLNGCCYGIPWSWGVDFGDGVLRLPTQLFEMGFHFLAFGVLLYYKNKVKVPGIMFKYYISTYLVFRFFTEFFRENERIWQLLTLYQLLALAGLILVNYKIFMSMKKRGVLNE